MHLLFLLDLFIHQKWQNSLPFHTLKLVKSQSLHIPASTCRSPPGSYLIITVSYIISLPPTPLPPSIKSRRFLNSSYCDVTVYKPRSQQISVADPGDGPGSPLIFRPNWGPKGQKDFFWRPPPTSKGLYCTGGSNPQVTGHRSQIA